MKLNAILIVCVVCAIIAELLFASVALQQDFPIFSASGTNQTINFVDVNGDVGAEDSRFMWNNTGLALIAQAFVLFAAAAATLGLLRNGEEKHA
jgi:hypothetical protein